ADLMTQEPYGLGARAKRDRLLPALDSLTRHHYLQCEPYRRIVDAAFGGLKAAAYSSMEELPFVPVSLFKQLDLRSVDEAAVYRTLTSSGTTGQAVSRIFLNQETA